MSLRRTGRCPAVRSYSRVRHRARVDLPHRSHPPVRASRRGRCPARHRRPRAAGRPARSPRCGTGKHFEHVDGPQQRLRPRWPGPRPAGEPPGERPPSAPLEIRRQPARGQVPGLVVDRLQRWVSPRAVAEHIAAAGGEGAARGETDQAGGCPRSASAGHAAVTCRQRGEQPFGVGVVVPVEERPARGLLHDRCRRTSPRRRRPSRRSPRGRG